MAVEENKPKYSKFVARATLVNTAREDFIELTDYKGRRKVYRVVMEGKMDMAL